MKIEITAGGIYGADGELPIGHEMTVESEPTAWAGRYRVISGGSKAGKTAVTNPAEAAKPTLPLEAKDLRGGWWAVTDSEGKEWGKKLRKEDADAFNGLGDDDKVAAATPDED